MKLGTKKIPQSSGVYFFRDKQGQILYIGKAANLRNRLNSYKHTEDARIRKMLGQAANATWQETDSEIEALILESQLIKKHRPLFNVMLRDDKRYFYIGFGNDEFPKIIITHRPTNSASAEFVGPFTDGAALKTTLKLLRRIFPYCTCKQKHNNYCLNYHIGKCAGLCCLRQQSPNFQFPISNFQKEYRKNIKAIRDILSGKQTTLIKTLKGEMENSAKKENFEEAASLRDKIEKLERVFENARILRNTNLQIRANATNQNQKAVEELKRVSELSNPPRRIEGYDVANIQGKFATGAMAVFIDGQPDKNLYRKFRIRADQQPNDIAMLKEVLTRRFNHPEWPWPDLIIVDGGKAQLSVAKVAISNFQFPTRALARQVLGQALISLSAPVSNKISKSKNSKKIRIPVIALTKDEKHRGTKVFIASKKAAIPLSKLPTAVRNLILQVDSEAHRFAIGYYRKLHRSHNI